MEAISLKLDESLLQNIDKSLKRHNYSTRTEFIRTAIREKLEELNKEQLIREFMRYHGKAGKTTTYKDNKKTRERILREIAKENGWD
ncbi:MAG: ribbon-helix-helix domain-containing protein [Nanoarchaeota archaeon]